MFNISHHRGEMKSKIIYTNFRNVLIRAPSYNVGGDNNLLHDFRYEHVSEDIDDT